MPNRNAITIIAALGLLSSHWRVANAEPAATQPVALYAPDSNHLWNRLHTILHVRTARNGHQFGQDSVDILLWSNTKHLLEGETHQQAIAVLDEFLQKRGEQLILDPLKRAILQRDLWACFDWAADRSTDHQAERAELESRLAGAIQRIALTRRQIDELPDVYRTAFEAARFPAAFDSADPTTLFLPHDLFDATGPWINISARDDLPVAPDHAKASRDHSVFEVYFRHPDERQAGLDYLDKLSKTPPYIQDPSMRLNPDAVQFPVGTELALVRRAILIDDQRKLAPTRLIESIQLRVYRRIDPNPDQDEDQAFFEFQLRRGDLFANPAGALHAFKLGDKDVSTFGGEDIDPFEDTRSPGVYTHVVLGDGCMGCHLTPGVQSMRSFTRVYPFMWSGIMAAEPKVQADLTIAAKEKRDDWKLLVEMMRRGDAH